MGWKRKMHQSKNKYVSYNCTKCGYRWALDTLMFTTNVKTKTAPKVWFDKKSGQKTTKKRRSGYCWCEQQFPNSVEDCKVKRNEIKT